MLSLRAHVAITALLFAAILGLAAIGNAIEAAVPATPGATLTAMIAFATLAACLAFSAVPVIVKLVLAARSRTSPGAAAAAAIRRERLIVLLLWGLMALGLALAIPAAIMDGAFE